MGTYCDNETLRDRVLNEIPTAQGLYEHKIAILVPAYLEGATTSGFYGEGDIHYKYLVRFPQRLAQSMVERGYLRISEDAELISLLKTKELRRLLKARGIKPGRTRESARIAVEDNIPLSDVLAEIPYRYFLLTPKGEAALIANAVITHPTEVYTPVELELARDAGAKRATRQELDDAIARHNGKRYAVRRNPGNWYWEYAAVDKGTPVWQNLPSVHEFEEPKTIEVLFGSARVVVVEDVMQVRTLSEIRKLLFGRQTAEDSLLEYCCFSEDTNAIETSTSLLKRRAFDRKHYPTPFALQRELQNDDLDEEGWHLGFSAPTLVGDEIARHSLADYGTLQRLENVACDSEARNYELTIAADDYDTYSYIVFLITKGILGYPSVLGMPIVRAANQVLNQTTDPILGLHRQDEALVFGRAFNYVDATDRLLNEYGNSQERVIEALERKYPPRYFIQDLYHYHYDRDGDWSLNRNNYTYLYEHRETYDARLRADVLLLKEKGILNVRWVNEFSLYSEVKRISESSELCG